VKEHDFHERLAYSQTLDRVNTFHGFYRDYFGQQNGSDVFMDYIVTPKDSLLERAGVDHLLRVVTSTEPRYVDIKKRSADHGDFLFEIISQFYDREIDPRKLSDSALQIAVRCRLLDPDYKQDARNKIGWGLDWTKISHFVGNLVEPTQHYTLIPNDSLRRAGCGNWRQWAATARRFIVARQLRSNYLTVSIPVPWAELWRALNMATQLRPNKEAEKLDGVRPKQLGLFK
jgi:hypothetical protein